MLCISTSERMLTPAITWSKTIKIATKLSKRNFFNKHNVNCLIKSQTTFGIFQPVDYLVAWRYVNTSWSSLKSFLISVFVSFILVLPLFWEPTMVQDNTITFKILNKTHVMLVSLTVKHVIEHFNLCRGRHFIA